MSTVSALPAEIVGWLSDQDELSHITFLTEFPAVKKAIPLKKVIVAIGLQSVLLTDKFVDNGEGILERQEYCRTATLSISLAIHVPFSLGGHTCHEVFTDVADCLNFKSDLGIEESGCGDITSDRDTDALVLTGYLRLTTDFCPAVSSALHFQSFLNKDLLCGSHIRDTDIHVSAEEKARWNTPFYVAKFTGTGTDTRTITLGFKPNYVALFAEECATVLYDAGTGNCRLYSAYAVPGGGTCGLEITNTGFKILHGPTHTVYNGVPYLNQAGLSYSFFALR